MKKVAGNEPSSVQEAGRGPVFASSKVEKARLHDIGEWAVPEGLNISA